MIIGILIAGIAASSSMISKFRLQTAESLTISSPIVGIEDGALWLETSLESSFDSDSFETGDPISSWGDQSKNTNKVLVTAVGNGPEYSNSINRVHAVKFLGSEDHYLEISDASFLNYTDYTIIVLEKRQSDSSNNYFIGASSTDPDDSLALGYLADGTITHAQGSNYYTSSVSDYSDSKNKARIFTFIQNSSDGKKTYVNGILAAESYDIELLSGISSLEIGKGYTGEIGEVVIFTRSLKDEERESIENYLGKKWNKKINRETPICLDMTVTDDGCDLSSATCSINEAGVVATVSATSTSASVSCNQDGYGGSVDYTCILGVADVVSSCSDVSCTIEEGGGFNSQSSLDYAYNATLIPSACQNGYEGSPTYTCVSDGAATVEGDCTAITCTVAEGSGFNAQNDLGYTLDPISITSACQSGYVGSPTYTCTESGAAVIDGSCDIICTIAEGDGFNSQTSLVYAADPTSISSACQSGYSGSPTYTCTTSGAATVTGDCTEVSCTIAEGSGFNAQTDLGYTLDPVTITSACQSGYEGSPTYTCASSGAATIDGECTAITCTIAEGSGFNAQADLGYTLDPISITSACQSGYSGTPTYTCNSSGAATVTGTCDLNSCTGGAIDTDTVSGEVIHTFTSSGTLTCLVDKADVQILVVAGGGGAGTHSGHGGSGGGGGGVTYVSGTSLSSAGSYAVTVGHGGNGKVAVANCGGVGNNGGDSKFIGTGVDITSNGGGRGVGCGMNTGGSGGSGGGSVVSVGGTASPDNATADVGTITISGNAGGAGYGAWAMDNGGGGGGGAGSAGSVGTVNSGGDGGSGIAYDISGVSVVYGSGGGGTGLYGGYGGAGAGDGIANTSTDRAAADADANRGGGGGSSHSTVTAGSGGSGVVIIRYTE